VDHGEGNHDFPVQLFLNDPYAKDPGLRLISVARSPVGRGPKPWRVGVTDGPRTSAGRSGRELWDACRSPSLLENLPLSCRDQSFSFMPVSVLWQEPTDLMWIRKRFRRSADHGR
jgi:hypothetical protein